MSRPFDKYEYYLRAVQDPDPIIDFVENTYREFHPNRSPKSLREDFCGTFALCCSWVETDKRRTAIGIDLSSEPLVYGKARLLRGLKETQRKRIRILQKNVLSSRLPGADVIAALNFSFFVLKTRKQLLSYFKNCRRALAQKGMFFIDCFGGPETMYQVEDKSRLNDFTYFWDQVSWDPISHHAKFHIHFKRRGERKRVRLFSYDWRMWTIPEILDLLEEAGFRESHIYWEGTSKDGGGNGRFRRVKKGEICEAWVAYIVAKP